MEGGGGETQQAPGGNPTHRPNVRALTPCRRVNTLALHPSHSTGMPPTAANPVAAPTALDVAFVSGRAGGAAGGSRVSVCGVRMMMVKNTNIGQESVGMFPW